jgi:CRISPR/Cas system-associated exonuclease Cas4 (RecB family)
VAERDREWMPIHAELGFGLVDDAAERDPESNPDAVQIADRWLVRGSIDLVEQHLGSGQVRVTDHKTGKPPDRTPLFVGGGEALQPLIYALAIEGIMNRAVESGSLYYCTPRGGYQRIEIVVTEEARERISQVMETIDAAVAAGFLPAAPREGACAWCDYRAVCGPNEELRASRKATAELQRLIALRGMP